ncbi:MAG: ATPase domain-containing protein [Candidatus Helarchaeota archaeon]
MTLVTPLPTLNEVLNGGIPLCQITHVYGEPGTGKTIFCLQVAAKLLKEKHDVLWIDCNNSFSLRKLERMANTRDWDYFSLVRIRDWNHFQYIFTNIEHCVHATTRLIILDNFTYFYRLCDRRQRHEFQKILFDRYLQRLVRMFRNGKRRFAVILTNQITADFTSRRFRPITQTECDLTCQIHILIEEFGDPNGSPFRKMTLRASGGTEISELGFRMTDRGFEVI